MQTRFDAQAIAEQCLELVTGDDNGQPHSIIHETGDFVVGVVKSFSNHYDGRLKLHLYDGRYVSWRLPQHVIDNIANIIRIDGNDGNYPERWDHV